MPLGGEEQLSPASPIESTGTVRLPKAHLAMLALNPIPSRRKPSAVTVKPPAVGPPPGYSDATRGSR